MTDTTHIPKLGVRFVGALKIARVPIARMAERIQVSRTTMLYWGRGTYSVAHSRKALIGALTVWFEQQIAAGYLPYETATVDVILDAAFAAVTTVHWEGVDDEGQPS